MENRHRLKSPIFEVLHFPVPHSLFKITSEKLTHQEKLFCVYLLAKFNQFGNQDFYLTDRQIEKELRISRKTIYLWRKRVKSKGFIDYESGKYRKSATFYHIKRVILGDESVSNLPNNKEVIKKEINKEELYNIFSLKSKEKRQESVDDRLKRIEAKRHILNAQAKFLGVTD